MTIKVEQFNSEKDELLEKALFIREKVFVEEENVPLELEHDGLENTATHYLLFLEGKAVATARHRNTDKGIKIERFAVLKEYRNKKLGQVLLEKMLDFLSKTEKKIYLHAQAPALNFYLRNNFVIRGEKFIEADIEHFHMDYCPE